MTDARHAKLFRPHLEKRTVISLSSRDLDDAVRLLQLLTSIPNGANQGIPHSASGEIPAVNPEHIRRRAHEIVTHRRRRLELFGKEMFAESAWDMLLLLYLQEGRERLTQARLGELSGASRSTSLRWIEFLEREQLVCREGHPTDRRHMFVTLSTRGRQRLELYLTETIG